MKKPSSAIGIQLWEFVPEVYRTRDEKGHLADYLDSFGELFDRIRQLLDQRLADAFPDVPENGASCQEWIVPYFADLLDVRLLSPHSDGRRAEVARAVLWRKSKGTIRSVEEIAEHVSLSEVETHEGWKRVARTPRVGFPILPATALGMDSEPAADNPLLASRHPGLPAVTIDYHHAVRAVQTDISDPRAVTSTFLGEDVVWRHSEVHGVPCFPGSFEDTSRRTVDVRTPDHRRGHFHPRRLILFLPPPEGFFEMTSDALKANEIAWSQRSTLPDFFAQVVSDGTIHLFNPSIPDGVPGEDAERVRFTTSPPSFQPTEELLVEDLEFDKSLKITTGRMTLRRLSVDKAVVDVAGVDPTSEVLTANECHLHDVVVTSGTVHLVDCVVLGTLTVVSGRVILERVAANAIVVHGTGADEKDLVLDARDCLIGSVASDAGTVRLEYCTLMGDVETPRIEASDCIFLKKVELTPGGSTPSCIRYSGVTTDTSAYPETTLAHSTNNTTDTPIFFEYHKCTETGVPKVNHEFGDPAFGVLDPITPESIRLGAEDGGEMGAYHHRFHSLAYVAVREKLREFLPVGIEPVLVLDARLLHVPPSYS